MMKICFISHPIGGDVESNLADLRRIIKAINTEFVNVLPLCSYYADVVSLDDNIPEQRETGMRNAKAVLISGIVDELWLTGRKISKGMREEMDLAHQYKIKIVDYINKL